MVYMYVYIYTLWIQTLSEKVLNPPNDSKLFPKHFLRRYNWIHRGYYCDYPYFSHFSHGSPYIFPSPRHRGRGRHRVHPKVRHGAVRAHAAHAEVEEVGGRHGGARTASDDATGEPTDDGIYIDMTRYNVKKNIIYR